MKKSIVLTISVLSVLGFAASARADVTRSEVTKLKPQKVSKKIQDQIFTVEDLPPGMRPAPGLWNRDRKAKWMIGNTWKPGSTITVAFNGGTPELQKLVAETANEWTKYGNIHFDFGYNPATGQYRQWTEADTTANIRIAFLPDGHWSRIGIDSKSTNPESQDNRSMNLAFGYGEPEERWPTIILHEFGHALGFGHEHQHPTGYCDNEFLWEDEPGYQVTWQYINGPADNLVYVNDKNDKRPGVYTRMIGAPGLWTRQKVDYNMRQLSQASAYESGFTAGPVDRKSIMHYGFEPEYFVKGKDSPCCIVEAGQISELDKQGIAKFYPPDSIEASH